MITVDNRLFLGISCESCCKAYACLQAYFWANNCSPAYTGARELKNPTGLATEHKQDNVSKVFSTLLCWGEIKVAGHNWGCAKGQGHI